MTPGPEWAAVQGPMLKYAQASGWKFIDRDAALTARHGESGLLFAGLFEKQLLRLNPAVLDSSNVGQVVQRIENLKTTIEGNEEFLKGLRGLWSIYSDEEKRELNLNLISYASTSDNVFQVTEEWTYTNGRYTNRADVVFLVNGLPLCVVENKAAHKKDGTWEGHRQIARYHQETPEMLALPQVFDLTHLVNFYYGPTWNLDRRSLFNWKEEEPGNFETKIKHFFNRERFMKVVSDYIVFSHKNDELKKLILRQHQVRAAEKVLIRSSDEKRKRGLVWHTQGSGKTLTMITAAHKVLMESQRDQLVLMLVDRLELEDQMMKDLKALGIKNVEVATTKKRLRELLKTNKTGFIVSMIHKFDKVDVDANTSKDVLVLVDEAHRSTGGDLGNKLMAALPNATYIGFTGTPIDKTAHGKGTFKVFGRDDPGGYMDKYSIAESIADKTTLKLHYTLAPNTMLAPSELLNKEFLELKAAEGVSDVGDLNRILDGAVNLKAFLKSDDRIQDVAHFVAKHFKTSVAPLGYKAFLVAVDREACALYKNELDKYLPKEASRVVYSQTDSNEPEAIKAFRLTSDEEEKVRKSFRKADEDPQILIVTEKLLTGFDAPILYCMYLDKPMRDHVLLQAIARVNRPYELEDETSKPAGLVLDFVGIFEKGLTKALAFDPDVVSGVIENLDVLKERFEELMTTALVPYVAFYPQEVDDKAVEAMIERFSDKKEQEAFRGQYKEVETLYEILSPAAWLASHIPSYRRLARLYQDMIGVFSARGPEVRDLMRKTELLVRQHVKTKGLGELLPVMEIDEGTLAALRKDGGTDASKVVNLARGIRSVSETGDPLNALVPMAERAHHVLELFEDRQIGSKDALGQLEAMVNQITAARREQEERGLDERTFAFFWMMRETGFDDDQAESVARRITQKTESLERNTVTPALIRDIKADLYAILLDEKVGALNELHDLVDRMLASVVTWLNR